jgi:hypothetical protein
MIGKLLSYFIAILRRKIFEETLISRFLSIILSSSFGRVAFKLSIWVKILLVQRGIWS